VVRVIAEERGAPNILLVITVAPILRENSECFPLWKIDMFLKIVVRMKDVLSHSSEGPGKGASW
jgi:hypothetical protein